MLCKLADYYEVSVDYLIGRELNEPGSLSVFELALVDTLRNSPKCVRESTYEIISVLNKNYDKI